MRTPPEPAALTLAAGGAGRAAAPPPVPVAVLARTSTLTLQDPLASLNRQIRSCREWLPPGFVITGYYWDVESGGIDLEDRSRTDSYQEFATAGVPRDGGMADLLAEAASPEPRFAAVVCEDIERSGRDTFNSLKLERALADQGVLLFATDEPADITGANATTILVRRIKQGVAEWLRLQIKESAWKGLQQHSLAGWNIGPAPYGYLADRIPHPVPIKAAQGRTKTRLILDPGRAPVVAAIYRMRVNDRLGSNAIATRLNTDPGTYPPSAPTGWSAATVNSILANPKYTGHMVYGRRRTRNGTTYRLSPDQWLWSPEPTHPVIITRDLWDAAQLAGKAHGTSRDGHDINIHPYTKRTFRLRGRVRCRDCQHRMSGNLRSGRNGTQYTYYCCPADPKRDPGHPASVNIREEVLMAAIREFFATRIFGPDRAELLAAQLPGNRAAAEQQRRQQETALRTRLRQIDTAEDAHAREITALADTPGNHDAITALRTRLIHRFTELETERASINTQLADLTATAPDQPDQHAELLARLPDAASILGNPTTPATTEQALYDAFNLQLLYKPAMHQLTLYATITDTTPQTLTAIINASENPDGHTTLHPRDQLAFSDFTNRPIRRLNRRRAKSHRDHDGRRLARRPAALTSRSDRSPLTSRRCPVPLRPV